MAKSGFRGGGYSGGGMNMNMIKQAQKMQADLIKMQSEMEEQTYSATSGGGVVTAVVTGKHELSELIIDPDAVDPEDVEMLQDLIVAAVNEAMRKASDDMSASMSKLTGGLNLGF
ncbi:MAG: YbaB/EbfC family nucleoid-associated protein [Oscillospiraceae bacterium]|nr:YbaB/EbfC family nucleoid-associated protein [Oscillospiraceae bacterium]